jgi:hypothetical protein
MTQFGTLHFGLSYPILAADRREILRPMEEKTNETHSDSM